MTAISAIPLCSFVSFVVKILRQLSRTLAVKQVI
jgi:hypothetical protein